jgi:Rieske 2Fe-2S family protein
MSIDTPTTQPVAAPARRDGGRLLPTLGSIDYCSPAVFALDSERIFHAGWMYACHVDGLPPGTKRTFDIAGESVIVTRDTGGDVHAFANVCRHRGAELCDRAMACATKGSIRCRYHSWTYGLDGELLATPRVDDEFDRGDYGLWARHADVWNGMIFVSIAEQPPTLVDWLTTHTPTITTFADLPVAEYRIGARTEAVVEANWKIIVENYAECLHCAVVHPELTDIIPLYRTGNVIDPDRDDGIVDFAPGAVAFTTSGASELTELPGYDRGAAYDGVAVFPNAFFDLTPTVLALTALFPIATDRTLVVGEYLFAATDVEAPGFDPSAEVELNELVGAQDYVVCEMVQRGVSSSAFITGGLTQKDEYVTEFVDRYLDIRGPLATD